MKFLIGLLLCGSAVLAQQSVRVVAAGDIACDPEMVGTTLPGLCDSDITANLIAELTPDGVLALGDIQYEHAELDHFAQVYDTTWGRFKAITHPTPGNHEYYLDASGYFRYFGAAAGEGAVRLLQQGVGRVAAHLPQFKLRVCGLRRRFGAGAVVERDIDAPNLYARHLAPSTLQQR